MIELIGKYTNAKIYANTIEDGVYQQLYDIINCKSIAGQKVVCMPDVHVGKSGPCGLVATIGDYICPAHVGVDIGCRVSMILLDKCLPKEKYSEFERRVRNSIPTGFNINQKTVFNEKELFLVVEDVEAETAIVDISDVADCVVSDVWLSAFTTS